MRLSRLLLPFFLLCSPWVYASDFYLGVNLGALDQSGEFRLVDSSLHPDVGIDSEKNLALPDEVANSVSLLAGYKLSVIWRWKQASPESAGERGVPIDQCY